MNFSGSFVYQPPFEGFEAGFSIAFVAIKDDGSPVFTQVGHQPPNPDVYAGVVLSYPQFEDEYFELQMSSVGVAESGIVRATGTYIGGLPSEGFVPAALLISSLELGALGIITAAAPAVADTGIVSTLRRPVTGPGI
jgi:hypothetical protein